MKLLLSTLAGLFICHEASSGGASSSESFDDTPSRPGPFNLTVIVLTMNRPKSLQRLLDSLLVTDFEFDDDKFDVEIHIDKTTGKLYEETIRIAEAFKMPAGHQGGMRVKMAEKNHGLRAAWFDAWYPKPDDRYCIIIEDDLEMSPFWFTWLRKAWLAYGNRTDIAGISLQRQFQMYMKGESNKYDPTYVTDVMISDERPFLYKMVGTWAFSPHPKRWREMLDWFNSIDNETFDPYVKGLITSDWLHMHTTMGKRHMTWEQWHVYHSYHHGLYTMYLNLPSGMALASNWREAGVHARRSADKKDFPTLDYCAIELQFFPDQPKHYDWDAWDERVPPEQRIFDNQPGGNNV